MQSQTIVCQTGRLALRHFTMEDLQPLAAMHCNPEVSRFIGGVKTLEQTRQRLLGWMEEYKRYGFAKWAVILRSTGEFIGRCGLSLEQFDDTSEWELGWTLARAYWGQGYATEAAEAAMQHCFRVLGHSRLISLIRPQNLASIRVAQRLGMQYERQVQWNGAPANLYALSAQDALRGFS
ncbi:MAG TPA: GNAT family N-acetyltransferase [Candidatus Angelobacter sp.]|nr:GNAT family N-acetyltransferase [Candidatus Angelobacter sp.]